MRSPFPGMDPYLEDPGGWGGVHDALIALLREHLNRQLGAGYIEALFERYRYAELIDYSGPPPAPGFPLDDAQWVAGQVQRWQATRTGNGAA